MKKYSVYIVIGLLILVIYPIYRAFNLMDSSSPEDAIKKFIVSQGFQNADKVVFPSNDRAAEGNGYFILAQFPDHKNQLFYASAENNQWQVVNIGGFNSTQQNISLSGNPNDTKGKMVKWGFSFVWLNGNVAPQAVVGYTRLAMDQTSKPVPFSFTQVGNFPLWIHKFPSNIAGVDYFKAFDKEGNEIWSNEQ